MNAKGVEKVNRMMTTMREPPDSSPASLIFLFSGFSLRQEEKGKMRALLATFSAAAPCGLSLRWRCWKKLLTLFRANVAAADVDEGEVLGDGDERSADVPPVAAPASPF
jgi:hypothetical protein